MFGFVSKDSYFGMLYGGNPVVKLADKSIVLNTFGSRKEEVRRYINWFACNVGLPLRIHNDWVVSYKQREIPFKDNMRLK